MGMQYLVSVRRWINTEENTYQDEWIPIGTTRAVSEKQAINNVRYRAMGTESQYLPTYISGHMESGLEWKAERVDS